MNCLLECMAYTGIVKIHLFYHILALRAEEAVVLWRESLRKDHQSKNNDTLTK